MIECRFHRPEAEAGSIDDQYQQENEPYLQFPHFLSKLVDRQLFNILQQCLDLLETGTSAHARRPSSDRAVSREQPGQRTHLPDRRWISWLPWVEEIRRDPHLPPHRRGVGSAPRSRWRRRRCWWALNVRGWNAGFRCPSSASAPSQPSARSDGPEGRPFIFLGGSEQIFLWHDAHIEDRTVQTV